MTKFFSFCMGLYLLTGCNAADLKAALSEAETDANTTASTSSTSTDSANTLCSYETSSVFNIEIDPTENFNVQRCGVQEVVSASSCDGITVGESQNLIEGSVARLGDTIRSSDGQVFTVSGLTLSQTATSRCQDGYRVVHELVSGDIDSFEKVIRITQKTSYLNDEACAPQQQQGPG